LSLDDDEEDILFKPDFETQKHRLIQIKQNKRALMTLKCSPEAI